MKCRYVPYKDDDGRTKRAFIPECWGGVNHGIDGCYCNLESERRDRETDMMNRIEKLEDQVRQLKKAMVHQ